MFSSLVKIFIIAFLVGSKYNIGISGLMYITLGEKRPPCACNEVSKLTQGGLLGPNEWREFGQSPL